MMPYRLITAIARPEQKSARNEYPTAQLAQARLTSQAKMPEQAGATGQSNVKAAPTMGAAVALAVN